MAKKTGNAVIRNTTGRSMGRNADIRNNTKFMVCSNVWDQTDFIDLKRCTASIWWWSRWIRVWLVLPVVKDLSASHAASTISEELFSSLRHVEYTTSVGWGLCSIPLYRLSKAMSRRGAWTPDNLICGIQDSVLYLCKSTFVESILLLTPAVQSIPLLTPAVEYPTSHFWHQL